MNKAEKARHKRELKLAQKLVEAFRVQDMDILHAIAAENNVEITDCSCCAGYGGLCGSDFAHWERNGNKYVVTELGRIYFNEEQINP